ncbi:hypothetical protein GRI97_09935 [Altererythrobacter xixiisoli]|uniref:Uncharacterized protein n=1 Tax=Croceibacterium xixiisoli TaxID=1476466 RepID=A0A6I4TXE2_9SPHN|nr:hypothetical protein [Croceibacterium xixiisoli]MXO99308.1 hypothetical protein [Croceibacterium xixiisoli]
MPPADIQEIEQDIVLAMAGNVHAVMDGEWEDREWVHLFVDAEIAPDGSQTSSITFALARKPGGRLEEISFRLPREAKRLLNDLAEAMRQPGGERWSSAQLRIEQDGRYGVEFSYDPPRRLGGDLLDKRFDDYLLRWLETPEGARFA